VFDIKIILKFYGTHDYSLNSNVEQKMLPHEATQTTTCTSTFVDSKQIKLFEQLLKTLFLILQISLLTPTSWQRTRIPSSSQNLCPARQQTYIFRISLSKHTNKPEVWGKGPGSEDFVMSNFID
jgi:hypothetical protein